MNVLLSVVNVLTEAAGPGIIVAAQCPEVTAYFVLSLQASIISILQVLWTLFSFEGWHRWTIWWYCRPSSRTSQNENNVAPVDSLESEERRVAPVQRGDSTVGSTVNTEILPEPSGAPSVHLPNTQETDEIALIEYSTNNQYPKDDTKLPSSTICSYIHPVNAYLTLPPLILSAAWKRIETRAARAGSCNRQQNSPPVAHKQSWPYMQELTSLGVARCMVWLLVPWASHFISKYSTLLNATPVTENACAYSFLILGALLLVNSLFICQLFFWCSSKAQKSTPCN
jgi:hypothetical protein